MTQEAPQEKPQPTAEDIVGAYIKLRNKKDQLTAKYKDEVKELDKRMAKLEAWLQIKMFSEKVNALPTNAGTAYKLNVEHASVSDMDALLDFIRENEAWHLLEKRVSKAGVRAYLDENQPLPPGVNWYTSTSIGVRKPNER